MNDTLTTERIDLHALAQEFAAFPGDLVYSKAFDTVLGREAVFTSDSGERMVGVLEEPTRWSGEHLVIRFPDGRWGRADMTVEVVAA